MKLTNGFEVEVDEKALDDWEVMEIVCELDGEKYMRLSDLFITLLGNEQYQALKKHLKEHSESGRCTTTDMSAALAEIFDGLKAGKK